MQNNWVSSGLSGLDNILNGLRKGDNVVWQIDSINDFRKYINPEKGMLRLVTGRN